MVSSTVAALAAGVLKAMVLTKLKIVALGAVVFGLAAGGGWLMRSTMAAQLVDTSEPPAQIAGKAPSTNRHESGPEAVNASLTQRPRLDNNGDPLVDGVLQRLGTSRLRAGTDIVDLAFSPDGRILASMGGYTGKKDRSIYHWDVKTGSALRQLKGHEYGGFGIAFSPDGKTLASAGDSIRIWDVATGKQLRALSETEEGRLSLAFSPSGDVLATVSRGAKARPIKLWNWRSGAKLDELKGHVGSIFSIAMSSDQMTVAAGGSASEIYLWTEGKFRKMSVAQECSFAPLAFSPNGQGLAIAHKDHGIRVYDLTTEKELFLCRGHQKAVERIVFAADGKTLVSAASDRTIRFWDASTGKALQVVPFVADFWDIGSVTFSPDAKLLAMGSLNSAIRLYDTGSGKEIHSSSGYESPITGLAFRSDNTLITTAWGGAMRHWDAATGRELHRFDGVKVGLLSLIQNQLGGRLLVSYAALSLDGTLRADYDVNKVQIRDTASGQPLHSFTVPVAACQLAAFSADNETLAVAGTDNAIWLCGAKSGKEIRQLSGHEKNEFKGRSNRVLGMAFAPDGSTLASCGQDRTARIWDAVTGVEQCCLAHRSDLMAVAFSPDGRSGNPCYDANSPLQAGRNEMKYVATTWVIYSTPQKNQKSFLVICQKAEWEAIEADRPGRNTLFKDGFLSETDAEKFLRRELSLNGSEPKVASSESIGKRESAELSTSAPSSL